MVAPLMACYHVVAGAATNWSKTEGLRLGSLRGARCHPPHNLPRWGICRGTIRITTPSMLGAVCKCAARMLLSPTTRRRLVSGRCKRESRRTPTHRRTPCPSRGPSRRRLCRPRPCERAGIPKPAKPTMKNHPNQQMAHSTSYCRQKHQVLVQKHSGGHTRFTQPKKTGTGPTQDAAGTCEPSRPNHGTHGGRLKGSQHLQSRNRLPSRHLPSPSHGPSRRGTCRRGYRQRVVLTATVQWAGAPPRLRVDTAMAAAGAMPIVLAVDAIPLTQLHAVLPRPRRYARPTKTGTGTK